MPIEQRFANPWPLMNLKKQRRYFVFARESAKGTKAALCLYLCNDFTSIIP